ncbi:MAG: ABC transporter ATP-binding protein [Deltaproteobacteria bacterium]|nr:MAG: ABC transporter ATP-binding protein [Deltaproteobacteria bacterium]
MSKKLLEINDLTYSYPDGTRALDGVSLMIDEGERVGIIGPNGAGKSTLLLHLNGILGQNGCVRISGMEINRSNLKDVRRKVGMIFQNPDDQLFCPTVFDDVAFGPRNLRIPEDEVARRVRQSLEAVGLMGFEERSAFHLSFGQKKRVAIATVLSMEPELLAIDELSSNLDPGTRRSMIQLLKELGGTQIIVSHDLDLVSQLCQRVIILNNGQKIAEGETREILRNQELLKANDLL